MSRQEWFHIPIFQFPIREPQHLKNTNPSGQRLRNVLHHPELLRAGQPEHSRLLFFVDQNFDERQQLRRILNLVDQYRRLMPFQKQLGIFFRQIAVTGNIQRNIILRLFADMSQKGRFADLPRSGQQNCRIMHPSLPEKSSRLRCMYGIVFFSFIRAIFIDIIRYTKSFQKSSKASEKQLSRSL